MYRVRVINDWGTVVSSSIFDKVDPFVEKMLGLDPDAKITIVFGNGLLVTTDLDVDDDVL